ncbi:MAG: amidohydrolase family protein [Deltaproteobacteria bacterium]|nr:amidohydrolase family protein [Deltaproteobacteria bacterium]
MIIDCDTHIMPEDAFDYVPEEFRDKAPVPVYSEEGLLIDMEFPGGPPEVPGVTPLGAPGSGAKMKGLVDLQVRLDEMPVLGVDQQFVLPQFSGWWTYMIEPELASAIARSYNLSNLRMMERHDCLVGVAIVQLQDVPAAIHEMEWAQKEGFCAVVLDKVFPVQDHPYGESLGSHKELWPFFARAEEMEMPIFLHNIQHGHRISNLPNFQKDGLYLFAPQEGQVSLVSLVTSGLLDDFPGLQFIFTEAGTGFIRPLVERLDAAFAGPPVDYDGDADADVMRGVKAKLRRHRAFYGPEVFLEKNKQPASHYFRNNFYFTIETEEAALPDAIEFLGAERFLFATDYPHDDPGGSMKFRDVQLLAVNKNISDETKELIRHGNAERLFKLDA